MRRLPLFLITVVASLGLVACGNDEPASAPQTNDVVVDAPMIERAEVSTDLRSEMPDIGQPINRLMVVDDEAGNGDVAKHGSVVSVDYHGWLYSPGSSDHKGKLFDRSKLRGPFTFRLGAGRVIRGWDHGILGMRQGGKRTLFIPADLAYAERGVPGLIPPNQALMFEIELREVKNP